METLNKLVEEHKGKLVPYQKGKKNVRHYSFLEHEPGKYIEFFICINEERLDSAAYIGDHCLSPPKNMNRLGLVSIDHEILVARAMICATQYMAGYKSTSHDILHVLRVFQNASKIMEIDIESGRVITPCEKTAIFLATLIHDVGDKKLARGGDPPQEEQVRKILGDGELCSPKILDMVCDAVSRVSFSKQKAMMDRGEKEPDPSYVLRVLRDADRLDAIGSVGIARAAAYAAENNKPLLHINPKKCGPGSDAMLCHFYQKLFDLKDMMTTEGGMKMAIPRHKQLVDYYRNFCLEADAPHYLAYLKEEVYARAPSAFVFPSDLLLKPHIGIVRRPSKNL